MIVLVDSSVWIDFVNGRSTAQTTLVDRAIAADRVVVGDLVLLEILQGLREDRRFVAVRQMLSRFDRVSLCGSDIAVKAAENYRLLRRRGITVRGTIDVIIATWCIENDVPIIHNDRDMEAMERELGLRAYA